MVHCSLKFFFFGNDAKIADYFDFMTPTFEVELSRVVESCKKTVQAPCVEGNSLSVSYLSCGTYGRCASMKVQLHKAQTYLLLKVMINDCLQAYCYQFKRVK